MDDAIRDHGIEGRISEGQIKIAGKNKLGGRCPAPRQTQRLRADIHGCQVKAAPGHEKCASSWSTAHFDDAHAGLQMLIGEMQEWKWLQLLDISLIFCG